MAHGAVGGFTSVVQGGKFGQGFASSYVTKRLSWYIRGGAEWITGAKNSASRILGAASAAITGGTISKLGGGKFANGAQTAAIQYLFNQVASSSKEGGGFFKRMWRKATAWHFEGRHAANGPLLTMNEAENQGFYGGVPADYHQDGVPGEEIKLVHADGREMIYDGVTGAPIGSERAGIMGTYNYVSMPERPAAGAGVLANIKFGASFIVRGIGHGVADVLPYKILGGNVRGSECAVNNCAP